MKTHVLKVDPEYMPALIDGSKTFDVRRNDRGFQRGDRLELVAQHPHSYGIDCKGAQCHSQPAFQLRTITYVYAGDPRFGGLQPGYVVLALGDVEDESPGDSDRG